ncbi:MAG TPA: hypothetical protein PKD53_02890 [Chloroflexaceae bacterium]|nr:hypothetical protein [Chloroflexaceae bacterium]
MQTGAHTPEELETLFEDTLVMRDGQALAALFDHGAVLVAEGQAMARGGAAIARLALARWSGEHTYVADPQCVVQARDLALIVTAGGINVAQRARNGAWYYAIVLVHLDAGGAPQAQAGGALPGAGIGDR